MDDAASLARLVDAFLVGLRRDGLEPDPGLRLLQLVGGADVGPDPADDPDVDGPVLRGPTDLGRLHESNLDDATRTDRGAWYTPTWLATDLVARALSVIDAGQTPVTVLDPSCGGGAFLLAAAERLHVAGGDPAVVARRLRGRDIDPVAVAVTEASVWWWARRHGVDDGGLVADLSPSIRVEDALVTTDHGVADAVVGNPPFLGQLRRSTVADDDRRQRLRHRYGDLARVYTDPAWLFLARAVELTTSGGVVCLVQPQSLLAARDAAAVRAHVDARALLTDLWIDDGSAFAAAVAVCAPVLHRLETVVDGTGARDRSGGRNDWTGPLADHHGVPGLPTRPGDGSGGRLGDIAMAMAGFRDEYYGLASAIEEDGHGPELVTVGSIDPFHRRSRVQRFASQRWTRPTVDRDRVTPAAARWIDRQAGPKVLVATQTKVIEAVADPAGHWVGSVPAIAVVPRDPARLWHVLAAVAAPVTSAWVLRDRAGTGLAVDTCRPTAETLGRIPLPVDAEAWDRAAEQALTLSQATGPPDDGSLRSFAAVANAAYGLTRSDAAAVEAWWLDRLPDRR